MSVLFQKQGHKGERSQLKGAFMLLVWDKLGIDCAEAGLGLQMGRVGRSGNRRREREGDRVKPQRDRVHLPF